MDGVLKISYKFKCRKCEETQEQQHIVFYDDEFPKPQLPFGWNIIGNFYYCNKHKITIEEEK